MELSARYSYLNLSDKEIEGGQNGYSLGRSHLAPQKRPPVSSPVESCPPETHHPPLLNRSGGKPYQYATGTMGLDDRLDLFTATGS